MTLSGIPFLDLFNISIRIGKKKNPYVSSSLHIVYFFRQKQHLVKETILVHLNENGNDLLHSFIVCISCLLMGLPFMKERSCIQRPCLLFHQVSICTIILNVLILHIP